MKSENLIEINFGSVSLSEKKVDYIVNNLPSSLRKLSLKGQNFTLKDQHVKILVERNKDLEELELSYNQNLTDESLKSITKHLNKLVKLNVSFTKINFDNQTNILEVKSMPKLKVLNCWHGPLRQHHEKRQALLPKVAFNQSKELGIAEPNNLIEYWNGLWNVQIKRTDLLADYSGVPNKRVARLFVILRNFHPTCNY